MINKPAGTILLGASISNIFISILFLISCLLICGCETSKVLTEAIVAECGTSTTYLSGWWTRMPDMPVQFDPMGGYQFAYWIDDADNVCHGTPGINGQPGIAVIKASKPKAFELAGNESFVTMEQLKAFQEIPVPLDKYQGSGLHFVQFFNNLVRTRNDGKAVKFPVMNGEVSIPNVIEVGKKSCIAPVALRTVNLPLPLPNPLPADLNIQSADMCKVRAMPLEVTMGEEDRKRFDAGNFAQGTKIVEVQ